MEKATPNFIKFKREFSAGCVVFKKLQVVGGELQVKYLLGKHSGYHKWVLPKGLIEEGERGWQTAVRETEEEMGVKVRLLDKKPIHKEQYVFYADYKQQPQISNDKFLISNKISKVKYQNPKKDKTTRRVMIYQEQGGSKVKVFKTVSFYLAEYQSGKPEDHGWEMSKADWYSYDKAFKILAFKAEKQALKKAKEKIEEIKKQPTLL